LGSRVAALFRSNSLLRVSPFLQTKSYAVVLFQLLTGVLQVALVNHLQNSAQKALVLRASQSFTSDFGELPAQVTVSRTSIGDHARYLLPIHEIAHTTGFLRRGQNIN
jgi:hypothetical protein